MGSRERKLLLRALVAVVVLLLLGAIAEAERPGVRQLPLAPGRQGIADTGLASAVEAPPPALSPPVARAPAAARTITYTYDANGRLTGVDYGEGKTITYRYDNAGNLTQQAVGPAASPTAAPRVYIPALLKDSPGGW